MAHVQEYYDPSDIHPSTQLPQARFAYSLDLSGSPYGYGNLPRDKPMAQPILQSPLRPEQHMQQSQWPMPQECIQSPPSNDAMRPPSQLWGQLPVYGGSMMWNGLPNEPLIMSETDQFMLTNRDLIYSQQARQHAPGKGDMSFHGSSFWASDQFSNSHSSATMLGSEVDLMLSPISPFSDTKHTYSPGPGDDLMTPGRTPAHYAMTPIMRVSSTPRSTPSTPESGSMYARQSGSAAPQCGHGLGMSPVGTFSMGNTIGTAGITGPCNSESSYEPSQDSSPGVSPWYPPGYRVEQSAMVQHTPSHQSDTLPSDHGPSSSRMFVDRSMRRRQPQWSNMNGVPAQGHFETRFMVPMTADEKALRTADDETLLQMKQDGYTYRDIRKSLRCKVAESTLRGRYRSLTKPRKERVRAPKWTDIDVILLKRLVQEEFDKLEVTNPSVDAKQKPDKIPWMKIVETMATTGGTYKFGAATAKKKWMEVTRSPPTRSSRRRSKV